MKADQIEIALDICLAVCAQDGLVSDVEEEALSISFEREFRLSKSKFVEFVDNFFNSDESIDDYISKLTEESLNNKIIEFSEMAASADGLDIRENIALQRIKSTLGGDHE